MAFLPFDEREVRRIQRAQQPTRALTASEPNVALEWVSCLLTALGFQLWEAENRYVAVFWAALTLTKWLIYALSITVTEQNYSL
jgi:hypothetical protein